MKITTSFDKYEIHGKMNQQKLSNEFVKFVEKTETFW